MIVHLAGTDTRHTVEWVDPAGQVLDLDELELDVFDADGDTVATDATADVDDDGRAAVHIPDTDETPTGIYAYTLRARSGADWRFIDAGMLRVRNP